MGCPTDGGAPRCSLRAPRRAAALGSPPPPQGRVGCMPYGTAGVCFDSIVSFFPFLRSSLLTFHQATPTTHLKTAKWQMPYRPTRTLIVPTLGGFGLAFVHYLFSLYEVVRRQCCDVFAVSLRMLRTSTQLWSDAVDGAGRVGILHRVACGGDNRACEE
jgi:hypothetical protein